VTRRGSNEVHGSFRCPEQQNGLTTFRCHRTLAPNKRNQFGFLLSGPVLIPKLYNGKDRTFFMFSWEWQRQRNGTTSTRWCPRTPVISRHVGDVDPSENAFSEQSD
jgi:hypothetical protein